MWVWIGTKKDGTGVYNWMHGDDYDTFSKEYSKPDEVLSHFMSEVCLFAGDLLSGNLDNGNIVELIWMYINLEHKMEEAANK